MPLAPVNDQGIIFHYEDSGAPPGSYDYATLVCIHGVQWNSGIFASLLPYAAPNNLRIVRLHLRDNAQSTRYSEEELKEINGKLAVQTVFMENRIRELAAFLQWFIEKEKIPPLHDSDGKRTGGLALVAWSGGNAFCVPLFGSAGKLPSHQKEFLEGYLRTYVLYDPPFSVFGAPRRSINELYNILLDPAVSDEAKAAAWIPKLVGQYSLSGAYAAESLTVDKLADLPPLLTFLAKLQTKPDPVSWDITALEPMAESESTWRSFMPILTFDTMMYDEYFKTALLRGYGPGKGEIIHFPRVKFEAIWCTESLPETVYGGYWAKRMMLEHQESGTKTRECNIHIIAGQSHAWHWRQPEEVAKYFASII